MVILAVFSAVSSGSIRGLVLFLAGFALSFHIFYMIWSP
jgi:hypothetical protein